MNIQDSPTLFFGGYFEQGDETKIRLSYPRTSRREAVNDANSSAEPIEWRVVVEAEITSVERVAGSNPPARKLSSSRTPAS